MSSGKSWFFPRTRGRIAEGFHRAGIVLAFVPFVVSVFAGANWLYLAMTTPPAPNEVKVPSGYVLVAPTPADFEAASRGVV